MEFRIGCSGWSYKGWNGAFYPKGTKPSDYLELYSRAFDTVEIDSTFYAIPDSGTVRSWRERTPDNFLFTAKVPKIVTHERKLENTEVHMGYFLESIGKLGDKLGMILVQFPHGFTYDSGAEKFRKFLERLPTDARFAVEFRHDSWFNDAAYACLKENNVTLAWSEVPMTGSTNITTSSSAYVRLVGDRSIKEEDFGTVRRDRTDVINRWARELENKKNVIDHTFVFSNNHFQGFGPATVNFFRQAVGVEPVNWEIRMKNTSTGEQKSLFDW
ncbi:MAG TPA: DUF72 domain-containing protein [Thermoplasmataceae archaeon]|nr:DUF72 domain-containing protein [Thermoplasmataceae archaeon]